jgi:hypothetical protein
VRVAAAAVIALAALFAAACSSGGESSGPLPQISEATAQRDVVDGVAKLSSTVNVKLDRSFKPAQGKVPFASYFELEVPNIRGNTTRVLVSKAEIGANSRTITLTVNALIADGSTLKIDRRAFNADSSGQLTAKVSSDLAEPYVYLASLTLHVTDPAIVGGEAIAPVKPEDRDPAAMRAALATHLKARGSGDEVTAAALARYDAIAPNIVPSPKLRAALAALTGTFAEPAIDYYLTNQNCTGRPAAAILFQIPPDAPQLLARVTFDSARTRTISVNPFAEGERLELLMPVLAHEAIHCDGSDGLAEEVAATAFDTFLYLHLLAAEPELARTGTKIGRELNVDAIAMINSGRRLPESVGLLPSVGVTRVLPDTNSAVGSFAEIVVQSYPGLTGTVSRPEALAQAYVANLAPAAGMQPGDPFDPRYLDELLGRATDPSVLVAVINALSLKPAG